MISQIPNWAMILLTWGAKINLYCIKSYHGEDPFMHLITHLETKMFLVFTKYIDQTMAKQWEPSSLGTIKTYQGTMVRPQAQPYFYDKYKLQQKNMLSSTQDQRQLIKMHPHPYYYDLTRKHLLPCRHQPSLAPPFHPILYLLCNSGTSNLSWTSGCYNKF